MNTRVPPNTLVHTPTRARTPTSPVSSSSLCTHSLRRHLRRNRSLRRSHRFLFPKLLRICHAHLHISNISQKSPTLHQRHARYVPHEKLTFPRPFLLRRPLSPRLYDGHFLEPIADPLVVRLQVWVQALQVCEDNWQAGVVGCDGRAFEALAKDGVAGVGAARVEGVGVEAALELNGGRWLVG